MTRVKLCTGENLDALEADINHAIEAIERDSFGVKAITDMSNSSSSAGYSVIIVYGNGPTTTQRWAGGTIG